MPSHVLDNTEILLKRIENRLDKTALGSPRMRVALERIGQLVENEAKLNVRRNRLIDTGRLQNSIKYKLYAKTAEKGVVIGSFGVPYAALYEFGSRKNIRISSHSRLHDHVWRRQLNPKPVVDVGAHNRRFNVQARPYLRPAFRSMQKEIMQTLLRVLAVSRSGQ